MTPSLLLTFVLLVSVLLLAGVVDSHRLNLGKPLHLGSLADKFVEVSEAIAEQKPLCQEIAFGVKSVVDVVVPRSDKTQAAKAMLDIQTPHYPSKAEVLKAFRKRMQKDHVHPDKLDQHCPDMFDDLDMNEVKQLVENAFRQLVSAKEYLSKESFGLETSEYRSIPMPKDPQPRSASQSQPRRARRACDQFECPDFWGWAQKPLAQAEEFISWARDAAAAATAQQRAATDDAQTQREREEEEARKKEEAEQRAATDDAQTQREREKEEARKKEEEEGMIKEEWRKCDARLKDTWEWKVEQRRRELENWVSAEMDSCSQAVANSKTLEKGRKGGIEYMWPHCKCPSRGMNFISNVPDFPILFCGTEDMRSYDFMTDSKGRKFDALAARKACALQQGLTGSLEAPYCAKEVSPDSAQREQIMKREQRLLLPKTDVNTEAQGTKVWFLIDANWFDTWLRYITDESGRAPRPGPLPDMLQKCVDHKDDLDELQHLTDFRGLHPDAWQKLHTAYGGGPPVPRPALAMYFKRRGSSGRACQLKYVRSAKNQEVYFLETGELYTVADNNVKRDYGMNMLSEGNLPRYLIRSSDGLLKIVTWREIVPTTTIQGA